MKEEIEKHKGKENFHKTAHNNILCVRIKTIRI